MPKRKIYYRTDQLKFGFGYKTREMTEHRKRIAFLFAFITAENGTLKKAMRKWREHNRYLERRKKWK